MALASGHGGAVVLGNGTTLDGFIKSWTLDDSATLHDVSVMGSGVVARTFLKGMETLVFSCEFVGDSAMVLTNFAPGSTLSSLTLDATGVSASAHEYVIGTAIVETCTFVKDVDGMARGTLRVRANQSSTITRPDGVV